jgi:nucleoside-diphosphate-sugar epimerase
LTKRILATTDWEIYGMDITSRRVGPLLLDPRFHFSRGDMTRERRWVDHHVELCDTVVPLAAIATPAAYIREPTRVFELDFEANLAIVRACVQAGRRLVFPSTSELYGMCRDAEFDEHSSPLVLGPINRSRWIYSCSKQMLERLIHAYGSHDGLRFTVFRPFNWIGPGLDDVFSGRAGASRVLTQFIGNVLRGEKIQLVNGGEQRRCFTYIDDGIDGLLRILENRDGAADQQVFNLGNPQAEASIRELAEIVLEEMGRYSVLQASARATELEPVDGEDYYGAGYQDVASRVPSVILARELLGWFPRTGLRAAVQSTVEAAVAVATERAA